MVVWAGTGLRTGATERYYIEVLGRTHQIWWSVRGGPSNWVSPKFLAGPRRRLLLARPTARIAAQGPPPARAAPVDRARPPRLPLLPCRKLVDRSRRRPSVAPTVGRVASTWPSRTQHRFFISSTGGRTGRRRCRHRPLSSTNPVLSPPRRPRRRAGPRRGPLWRVRCRGGAHARSRGRGAVVASKTDGSSRSAPTPAPRVDHYSEVARPRPYRRRSTLRQHEGRCAPCPLGRDGAAVWAARLDGEITALAAVEGRTSSPPRPIGGSTPRRAQGPGRWRYRVSGAAIGLVVDDDRVVAVMLDQTVRAFKIGSGAQACAPRCRSGGRGRWWGSSRSSSATRRRPILDRRTGGSPGL